MGYVNYKSYASYMINVLFMNYVIYVSHMSYVKSLEIALIHLNCFKHNTFVFWKLLDFFVNI